MYIKVHVIFLDENDEYAIATLLKLLKWIVFLMLTPKIGQLATLFQLACGGLHQSLTRQR